MVDPVFMMIYVHSVRIVNVHYLSYVFLNASYMNHMFSVHQFQGEHHLYLPMMIESRSWMLAGNYQGQIEIESNTGQKSCMKIDQILIKT